MHWLRRLFARWFSRPVVRWEDGVIDTDPKYARLYAEVVQRVRAARPDAVQSPDFRVTVRLYPHFPDPHASGWGKVLPPNQIAGDAFGTLCLNRAYRVNNDLIRHECAHAVTGIPDHPAWLFGPKLTLNV
ncbi:MAG: hypothetical protein WC700_14360 [Gemmatimonadaceae bacterium]|jgi:hypothetical protein